MATFTINSRKHGEQVFSVRGDGEIGYVRVNGRQICDGGCFSGSTIMCRESSLEKTARAWWNAKMRNDRTEKARYA